MASGFGSWGKTKSGAKVFATASAMSAGGITKEDFKNGGVSDQAITEGKNKVAANQAARKATLKSTKGFIPYGKKGYSYKMEEQKMIGGEIPYLVLIKHPSGKEEYLPIEYIGKSRATSRAKEAIERETKNQRERDEILKQKDKEKKQAEKIRAQSEKELDKKRTKVSSKTETLTKQLGKNEYNSRELQALFEVHDTGSGTVKIPPINSPEYKKIKEVLDKIPRTPKNGEKRDIDIIVHAFEKAKPVKQKISVPATVYGEVLALHKKVNGNEYNVTDIKSGKSIGIYGAKRDALKAISILQKMDIPLEESKAKANIRFAFALLQIANDK